MGERGDLGGGEPLGLRASQRTLRMCRSRGLPSCRLLTCEAGGAGARCGEAWRGTQTVVCAEWRCIAARQDEVVGRGARPLHELDRPVERRAVDWHRRARHRG